MREDVEILLSDPDPDIGPFTLVGGTDKEEQRQ